MILRLMNVPVSLVRMEPLALSVTTKKLLINWNGYTILCRMNWVATTVSVCMAMMALTVAQTSMSVPLDLVRMEEPAQ